MLVRGAAAPEQPATEDGLLDVSPILTLPGGDRPKWAAQVKALSEGRKDSGRQDRILMTAGGRYCWEERVSVSACQLPPLPSASRARGRFVSSVKSPSI